MQVFQGATTADASRRYASLRQAPLVDRLPNEILMEIFEQLYLDLVIPSGGAFMEHTILNFALPVTSIGPKLSAVCRRWREVAVATRNIWRCIKITKRDHVGWLATALARSDPHTVDLVLGDSRTVGQVVPPLLERTHRLQRLSVYLPPRSRGSRSRLDIRRLLDATLSNLDTLAVVGRRHSVSVASILRLSSTKLPSLRHLCLGEVHVPWNPPLFAALRTLHLICCRTRNRDINLEQLIDVFAAMTQLEDLIMDRSLPYNALWFSVLPRPAVQLPCLRTAFIREACTQTEVLLAHLALPSSVHLSVFPTDQPSRSRLNAFIPTPDDISRYLYSNTPNIALEPTGPAVTVEDELTRSIIPLLRDPLGVELRLALLPGYINVHAVNGCGGHFFTFIRFSYLDAMEVFESIAAFMMFTAMCHKLTILGDLSGAPSVAWVALFDCLPDLEELRASSETDGEHKDDGEKGDLDYILEGLEGTLSGGPKDGVIGLRNLKLLLLSAPESKEDVEERAVKYVASRRMHDAGATRLVRVEGPASNQRSHREHGHGSVEGSKDVLFRLEAP